MSLRKKQESHKREVLQSDYLKKGHYHIEKNKGHTNVCKNCKGLGCDYCEWTGEEYE